MIESKEFYKHFSALKRKLDQQSTSHHRAGEFLHTLKTLMAKLKVFLPFFSIQVGYCKLYLIIRQMIGELFHVRFLVLTLFSPRIKVVETMATHRANALLANLSNALETGFSEVFPERKPLKVCS